MSILDDVNKSIEEIWSNPSTPRKILMPYSEAATLGLDLSHCIPGEPVEISDSGIATAIWKD